MNSEKASDDPFRSNGRTGQDGLDKDLTAALFVSIPKSGRKVKNHNGGGVGKRGGSRPKEETPEAGVSSFGLMALIPWAFRPRRHDPDLGRKLPA
jgi:hypothetical protein